MKNIPTRLLAPAFLVLSAFFGHGADEGIGKYEALIKRNPFLPKSQALIAPSAPIHHRLTGLVTVGVKNLVGIENMVENKSYLLAVGQKADDIEVKEINVKDKRVIVIINGGIRQLDLSSSLAMASSLTIQPPPPAVEAASPAPSEPSPPQPSRRRIQIPKRR